MGMYARSNVFLDGARELYLHSNLSVTSRLAMVKIYSYPEPTLKPQLLFAWHISTKSQADITSPTQKTSSKATEISTSPALLALRIFKIKHLLNKKFNGKSCWLFIKHRDKALCISCCVSAFVQERVTSH